MFCHDDLDPASRRTSWNDFSSSANFHVAREIRARSPIMACEAGISLASASSRPEAVVMGRRRPEGRPSFERGGSALLWSRMPAELNSTSIMANGSNMLFVVSLENGMLLHRALWVVEKTVRCAALPSCRETARDCETDSVRHFTARTHMPLSHIARCYSCHPASAHLLTSSSSPVREASAWSNCGAVRHCHNSTLFALYFTSFNDLHLTFPSPAQPCHCSPTLRHQLAFVQLRESEIGNTQNHRS